MKVFSLLLWLVGCGTPAPPDRGHMELGTIDGASGFVALHEGDSATLVEGAQGGFHVWMKFRLAGVAPGELTLGRQAHRGVDGKLVLKTEGSVVISSPSPDGVWELPNALPMFMCPSPIGLSVIDQPIEYELVARDSAGEVARSAITLVPHCPVENHSRAFCERICTG